MRVFVAAFLILTACDQNEGQLGSTFEVGLAPTCSSCPADFTHSADVLVRKTNEGSRDASYDCMLIGDDNIVVAEQGQPLGTQTSKSRVQVRAGEVASIPYDFRCTGDGVLTVRCEEERLGDSQTTEEAITCLTAPAGPAAAVVDMTVNSSNSAFATFLYSAATAFSESITAEAAQITDLPIGSCVEYVRDVANVTLESAGTVEIKNDSALVATLNKSPSSERREFGPFNVTPGTAYDVVIGGAGAVAASVGNNVLRPAPIATFTNLTFTDDTLSTRTFTYQPVTADYLFLIFAYVTNTDAVTLWCRLDPAGTSFTMPQADFDGLSLSGTVRAETQNRGTFTLGGVNSAVLVNAHSSTMNGQFTKPSS